MNKLVGPGSEIASVIFIRLAVGLIPLRPVLHWSGRQRHPLCGWPLPEALDELPPTVNTWWCPYANTTRPGFGASALGQGRDGPVAGVGRLAKAPTAVPNTFRAPLAVGCAFKWRTWGSGCRGVAHLDVSLDSRRCCAIFRSCDLPVVLACCPF
jgi:hypothetical protein